MWLLEKIRVSVESIPSELRQFVQKSEETRLSNTLNSNILTPDNIPEFCLPPRLFRRNTLLATERTAADYPQSPNQTHGSHVPPDAKCVEMTDVGPGDKVTRKVNMKLMPFSAEGYGLAGIYESPNTRRKESLFHSRAPRYILDRSLPQKLTHGRNLPKTTPTLPGLYTLFSCKSLSETGSTESETQSSNDSSPISSPYNPASTLSILLDNSSPDEGVPASSSFLNGRTQRRRLEERELPLKGSVSGPPFSFGSPHTLAPPVFSLDVLHCQERLQREHVLPLPARGKVRLSAERTAPPSSHPAFSWLFTVRIRVVSVEDLRDGVDGRPVNCALSLCLAPGKLQRQESATVRNCQNPIFNEDFFFTELSQDNLRELDLRLKVLDKPGSGALRRETVMGVITKPLSELLPQ